MYKTWRVFHCGGGGLGGDSLFYTWGEHFTYFWPWRGILERLLVWLKINFISEPTFLFVIYWLPYPQLVLRFRLARVKTKIIFNIGIVSHYESWSSQHGKIIIMRNYCCLMVAEGLSTMRVILIERIFNRGKSHCDCICGGCSHPLSVVCQTWTVFTNCQNFCLTIENKYPSNDWQTNRKIVN